MRVPLIPLALVTLMSTGCSERPNATGPLLAVPASPPMAKAPPLSTVALVVTVADGSPYRITSDGQGSYTDGTQDVQAKLDQYGTFAFNTKTSSSRKAAVRWVNYDFNSPVDPANLYRPSPSTGTAAGNYHFSTGGSAFSPFIPIQNLGVNGNPSSTCGYMGNSVANSSTTWRVSFHKGYEDVANSPTAYAVFTRTSVSPAVWTVTPVGSCSPNSNVAALRSSDGSVLYGYYNLPFFFTLTVKP